LSSIILNLKIFVQAPLIKIPILEDAILMHTYTVERKYPENCKPQAIILFKTIVDQSGESARTRSIILYYRHLAPWDTLMIMGVGSIFSGRQSTCELRWIAGPTRSICAYITNVLLTHCLWCACVGSRDYGREISLGNTIFTMLFSFDQI